MRIPALSVRIPKPILLALAAAAFLVPLRPPAASGHEALTLGVHPYQPDEVLNANFAPLAEHLAAHLGIAVEVRVGRNYEEHVHAVGTGRVDLAFIGPAGYVNLTRVYGPQDLIGKIAVGGKPFFRGHLVVTETSPLREFGELAGRRLAFVDPFSTMYLVPAAMLHKAGLTGEDLAGQAFLGSHHNVALGVLAGDFAAGAVKEEVFLQYKGRGLRSLGATMEIPEHPFVLRPGLDPAMAARIREAFLALGETESGRAILERIKKGTTAVLPARDTDYDALRQLLRYLQEDGGR